MRRLPPLVLVLACLAAPATAAAQDDARYALANGCYGLKSNALGRQVATDVGPLRMQPTRLGQYLLYGKAGDFRAADSEDRAGSAPAPDGSADWKVEGTADA